MVVEQSSSQESGGEDFAEAGLSAEVVTPGKERGRRNLGIEQLLETGKEDPVGEGELDVGSRQVLLERLDGRVVAARLVADGDRHAAQVGRGADRRFRWHEHRGRRYRIRVRVHLAVTLRGGGV